MLENLLYNLHSRGLSCELLLLHTWNFHVPASVKPFECEQNSGLLVRRKFCSCSGPFWMFSSADVGLLLAIRSSSQSRKSKY